jgi:hypothetical protein
MPIVSPLSRSGLTPRLRAAAYAVCRRSQAVQVQHELVVTVGVRENSLVADASKINMEAFVQ